MFINELPEECLLNIFGHINGLKDLLNCYKVCNKWSLLIAERTRKVQYLADPRDCWNEEKLFPSYSLDHVYYRAWEPMEPIEPKEPMDVTCLSTLFPNLIITELPLRMCIGGKHEAILTFVKKRISLNDQFMGNDPIYLYIGELEMASASGIQSWMKRTGINIKQLCFSSYTLDQFTKEAYYFPNLERLSIHNSEDYPDRYSDGPIMRRLKIVELALSSCEDSINRMYYGFQFMDSCPNLQSAYIYLNSNRIYVDESRKHESLQDLVIESYDPDDAVDWNELKRLFIKYPNLKHLALRRNYSLTDEQVEQLVNILPNLVLFDVRGCPGVTQQAADYVQDYCKLYGRLIKFYFDKNRHELGLDWPQLSTKCEKISQGFDFMKNCFLKDFNSLPTFLISNED